MATFAPGGGFRLEASAAIEARERASKSVRMNVDRKRAFISRFPLYLSSKILHEAAAFRGLRRSPGRDQASNSGTIMNSRMWWPKQNDAGALSALGELGSLE